MANPVSRIKTRDDDAARSGAIQVIPICFSNLATGTAYGHTVDLPAGMKMRIIDINVQALGVSGNPQVTVGSSKAGTQIVAAATLTTNLGSLTLKNTNNDSQVEIAAGGLFEVRVTNDGDDTVDAAIASITAYVSAPPSSMYVRNADHY